MSGPAIRFQSKVDLWIAFVLIAVIAMDLLVLVNVFEFESAGPRDLAIGAVILAVVSLIGWMLIGTWYEVSGDSLRVACGPFRWTLATASIRGVRPSRAWWSSPALSLDRLRIDYGDRRWVLVSPRDKEEFIAALKRSGARIGEG